MREWFYTLRQRFTPQTKFEWSGHIIDWNGYISFSGFQHITELVSLDGMLCPELITDLIDVDWNYNVHESYRIMLFRDADYLKTRLAVDPSQHQILAIIEHPDGDEPAPVGFITCGFDIMDASCGYSTLTNCGQMPEIFDSSIVNEYGLLPNLELANEIRDRMRRAKPDDYHLGKCEVWSVCRGTF